MKYWDSSALVALLVQEKASSRVIRIAKKDPDISSWWGTKVECVSAIARLARQGDLDGVAVNRILERLEIWTEDWEEIQPGERIREIAIRCLRMHSLRAADALQLAAAWIASEHKPSTLEFMTLDERLSEAAAKEGFRVLS